MRFAVTIALLLCAVAFLSCDDPLGPLVDGTPYALTRINGEPVPWTSPFGGTTTEGWIKIVDDTTAHRYEAYTNGGASGSWMMAGRYTLRFGRLVIDYGSNWNAGYGPLHHVDTFFVSGNGVIMRETGFIAPLDTLVRYYARP